MNRGTKPGILHRRFCTPAIVEPLEPRILLSGDLTVVTAIEADNRGLIELFVSHDLNPATVTSQAIRVLLPGNDGLLGTPDDALASIVVTYTAATRKITISANIEPGQRYGVRIDGSLIRDSNGRQLDAEFNGQGVNTGNGVEGGILEFFPRVGEQTVVRFRTVLGDIFVEMFTQETPITVTNFFNYMNRADYDQTIIHRSASLQDGTPFVIQGGGFQSDIRFTPVPTDPPILNEPGISNLRGTLAMAKLGGNPNSATSQWFFNLGNNSANLDTQNGGFTVFGRVLDSQSLAIMDALAALETVNASSINSAFNELPVLDIDVVNERNPFAVFASDTARIFRVAQQLEISAEPFRQIETQNAIIFTSPDGQATVTLFSLTGVPLGNPSDFVRVNFSSGSAVSSVQITGNLIAPVGIQVTGASSIGSIIDRRNTEDFNLRFIVTNTTVNNIRIAQSIHGENINGTLLSGNTLLPEDIDNDGSTSDPTAILVLNGSARSIVIQGNLTGSIVAPSAVGSLTVRGTVNEADFLFGSSNTFNASNLRFGTVVDSTLSTSTPVNSLTAAEWVTRDRAQTSITAPAISTLRVTGGRDVEGNLEANINLQGDGSPRAALMRAVIAGNIFNSNWTIANGAGVVQIGGFTNNWTFTATGDVRNLQATELVATNLNFTGNLGILRAAEWTLGSLNAQSVIRILVTGNRDYAGDLNAQINLGQTQGRSATLIRVDGEMRGSTINAQGELRNLQIRGDVIGSNIGAESLRVLQLGYVADTNLTVSGEMNRLIASEWDGGSVDVTFIRGVVISGDSRRGLDGNFFADFNGNLITTFRVQGDMSGDFSAFEVRNFQVLGGVENSRVLFQQSFFGTFAAVSIFVGGAVTNSTFAANGLVGTLSVGTLTDSMILAGTNNINQFGFPNNAAGFNRNVGIDNVIVRGLPGTETSMENSFILAGFLNRVRVVNPTLNPAGLPYGVAAIDLNRVELLTPERGYAFNSPTTGQRVENFHVRPNFQAPTS